MDSRSVVLDLSVLAAHRDQFTLTRGKLELE